jgi:glycerate 2-kinase
MKVLIAPDKFKGSISAVTAAEAIARGLLTHMPDAELELAPIADGGEGFAEALCAALHGEWIQITARDPIGRDVSARYAWMDSTKVAVIEMSEASGLWRLTKDELAPLRATTFGTGQLIRDAAQRGAKKIIIGLGGSATTDGGIGMAEALGYEFLTSDGESLEAIPENLLALIRVNAEAAIDLPEIIAACDVQNPLSGSRGTAHVFSPQKGASPKIVDQLELCLENLADVLKQDFECDFRDAPGAGAAGGLGFGLLSFCRAKIESGFDVVANVLKLEERIAAADLVITGEGRLDGQTLEGKGPAGVAALAQKLGKPTLAFAGSIAEDAAVDSLFAATCPIVDRPTDLDDAMRHGAEFLERAARRAARLLIVGKAL